MILSHVPSSWLPEQPCRCGGLLWVGDSSLLCAEFTEPRANILTGLNFAGNIRAGPRVGWLECSAQALESGKTMEDFSQVAHHSAGDLYALWRPQSADRFMRCLFGGGGIVFPARNGDRSAPCWFDGSGGQEHMGSGLAPTAGPATM